VSVTGAQIIAEAKKFLGDPYVYGAAGPASFDCSGLVKYTLEQLGLKGVPRTSEAQWGWVQKISRS
jgi:peptidoglycan DL-endopeptidase CwlO